MLEGLHQLIHDFASLDNTTYLCFYLTWASSCILAVFTLHMINTRGSALLKKKVYVFIGIFISLMIPILFIVMGYVATGLYLILEVLYVTVSSGIQNF